MPYANEDQRKMAAVWRSKAWKARVRELLDAYPRCEWCNGYSKVINHRRPGFYPGYELGLREEVDVICMECHRQWSGKGTRRHRLYDDCTACGAAVYRGRKVCWICGSDEIRGSDLDPARKLRLVKILASCPDVHEGDVWSGVWMWPGPVTVKRFDRQEVLPWPMVKTVEGGEVGLPAFMFGKLEKRGQGASWKALFEQQERPASASTPPRSKPHPYS